MAAPVVQSTGTSATGTGTSITTNAPAGVAVGDFLLLCVGVSSATTISTPTGWTDISTVASAGSEARVSMFYRIATGGADDTPTVSLGASVAYGADITRIDGQHSSPIDTFNTNSQTSGSAPSLPNVTTATADELLMGFMALDSPINSFTSNPTGWTQQQDIPAALVARLWKRTVAAAGLVGGAAAGITNSDATAQMVVAIKSSAATSSTFDRSFSENLAITEEPKRACTDLRRFSETMALQEVQLAKPNYHTFTPENLAASDSPKRACINLRTATDNMGLQDSFSFRLCFFLRQITDSLAMYDTLGDINTVGLGVATIRLSEFMALTDDAKRACDFFRQLSETMKLADSATRQADASRSLSEMLAVSDLATRAVTALRRISESLGISTDITISVPAAAEVFRGFYRPWSTESAPYRPANTDTEEERSMPADEQQRE